MRVVPEKLSVRFEKFFQGLFALPSLKPKMAVLFPRQYAIFFDTHISQGFNNIRVFRLPVIADH